MGRDLESQAWKFKRKSASTMRETLFRIELQKHFAFQAISGIQNIRTPNVRCCLVTYILSNEIYI